MTLVLSILVATSAGFWLLFRAVRGQKILVKNAGELQQLSKPLDLLAFKNLIDPDRDEFLKTMVDQSTFHELQKDRARVILAYIKVLAFNAAVLLRLGEMAETSPNAEVAQAGRLLAREALATRILCLRSELKLFAVLLLPQFSVSCNKLVSDYERLKDSAAVLCQLLEPRSRTAVLAAL